MVKWGPGGDRVPTYRENLVKITLRSIVKP